MYTDAVYRRAEGGVYADETFCVFAARLAKDLDRLVLTGRLDPAARRGSNPLPAGVGFVELPHYGSLMHIQTARAFVSSAVRFFRLARTVDVVWLMGPHPLAVVFAITALVTRTRVVLGVRQDMPAYVRWRHPGRGDLLAAGLALEGLWRALALACPTVVVGSDLARRYRHAKQVADISVSLVEEADIAAAGWQEEDGRDPFGLLSVGRLDPEKNPLLLADVLALLVARDDRWRLTVCGDGSLRADLVRRLREYGIDGHADLLGLVPLADLRTWYRRSGLLLHVSWTEGFPQVLLEALAYGLPVVATDVGAVASQVAGAALVVPPGDSAAAAEAVSRLSTDGALRARLRVRGMQVVRERTGDAERQRVLRLLFPDQPSAGRGH